MQYLVSVIDDRAGLATPDEMAAIDVFNDRLKAEDHWVFAGGLAAPSSATVIDNRGEEAMFSDDRSWNIGATVSQADPASGRVDPPTSAGSACPSRSPRSASATPSPPRTGPDQDAWCRLLAASGGRSALRMLRVVVGANTDPAGVGARTPR